MKVDRVRANHSLRLTASQGTPNIPFHWFQLFGSYRQAQKKRMKRPGGRSWRGNQWMWSSICWHNNKNSDANRWMLDHGNVGWWAKSLIKEKLKEKQHLDDISYKRLLCHLLFFSFSLITRPTIALNLMVGTNSHFVRIDHKKARLCLMTRFLVLRTRRIGSIDHEIG